MNTDEEIEANVAPWRDRALAAEGKLSSCEKQRSDAVELLKAMVLAMRSGASTDEMLETIRGGLGIVEHPT